MTTYKKLKNEIKELQKKRASHLREIKRARKPKVYEAEKEHFDSLPSWYSLYWDYRHTHIAYCSFFNKTSYEKIEQPADDNQPNLSRVEDLKTEWQEKMEDGDETIRLSA